MSFNLIPLGITGNSYFKITAKNDSSEELVRYNAEDFKSNNIEGQFNMDVINEVTVNISNINSITDIEFYAYADGSNRLINLLLENIRFE
jgi:hypothetical protein